MLKTRGSSQVCKVLNRILPSFLSKLSTAMIATVPNYKPRRSIILVQCSVALLLLLSPVLVRHQLDLVRRASVTGEFQSSRSSILSSIDRAAERQDFDTLKEINDKYARYVSDGTFRSALDRALAKVAAQEAALELRVSKHLDVLRNQEEAPDWPLPQPAQIAQERNVEEQTLSKLPR